MSSLKKEVKHARLFEIQKITRRLRALENKRGSESQLEKNRRKVERLRHELELVKDIDITNLCSSIQAKDEYVIRLSMSEQPPASPDEKAKWRLLTSKIVSSYMKKMVITFDEKNNGPVKQDKLASPDQEATLVVMQDEDVMSSLVSEALPTVSTDTSSKQKERFMSTFLASLSGLGKDEEIKRTSRKAVKRNRLGQRSRRRLWEKKYGVKAKHVLKTTSSKRKRNSAGQRTAPGTTLMNERERSSKSDATIHPSWAAKKQLQTGITQFQGQKITFDSD